MRRPPAETIYGTHRKAGSVVAQRNLLMKRGGDVKPQKYSVCTYLFKDIQREPELTTLRERKYPSPGSRLDGRF